MIDFFWRSALLFIVSLGISRIVTHFIFVYFFSMISFKKYLDFGFYLNLSSFLLGVGIWMVFYLGPKNSMLLLGDCFVVVSTFFLLFLCPFCLYLRSKDCLGL